MVDIEVTEEKDTTGTVREAMEVLADAAVDATMAAVVPVDMEKIHGEDSNLKKKKEKNSRNTRKN